MLIYKHTCSINNKSYIGLTTLTLHRRLKEHLKQVRFGSKYHFHNAIRKYGIETFTSEILEDNIIDKEILKQREIYWIKHYNTFLGEGYNMTDGGDGCNGGKLPLSHLICKNLETGLYLMVHKNEFKLNNNLVGPNYGNKHSKETIEKYKTDRKGQVPCKDLDGNYLTVSKEEYEERDDLIGVWSGRKHSEEYKKKMSIIGSGKNNAMAVITEIYNENDELMFSCEGSFKKTCEENNLPLSALGKSIKTKTPIYLNIYPKIINKLIDKKWYQYKGWYAKTKDKLFV